MFQVTFEREALKQGLETVRAANNKGSTLPVLQCVLLEAGVDGSEGFARVTATDLALALQVAVQAKVQTAGAVCVHLGMLYAVVNGLTDERVTLTVEDKLPMYCKVESESFAGTVAAQLADEFPRVTFGQVGEYGAALKLELARDAVKRIRRAVAPFAGNNDARESLNYMCWRISGDELEVAAADGFRLAKLRVVDFLLSERENGDTLSFLVMPRFLAKLDRDDADPVTLWFYPTRDEAGGMQSGGYAVAQAGNVWVRGVVGDGNPPNYDAVLANFESHVQVTAQVAACKYALGLTQIFNHKIELALDAENSRMLMRNVGTAERVGCVIPIPAHIHARDGADAAEPFEISMNGLYLQDVLNGLQSEEVEFEFENPAAPIRFSTRTYTALVMPMYIGRERQSQPATAVEEVEAQVDAHENAEAAFVGSYSEPNELANLPDAPELILSDDVESVEGVDALRSYSNVMQGVAEAEAIVAEAVENIPVALESEPTVNIELSDAEANRETVAEMVEPAETGEGKRRRGKRGKRSKRNE